MPKGVPVSESHQPRGALTPRGVHQYTVLAIDGPGSPAKKVADGIKALTKEDVVPRAADKLVHFLAPVVLVIPVLLSYAVLPVGRNMTAVDLDAGVLFFFAVGAATEPSCRAYTVW